jgi:hypothetical protein
MPEGHHADETRARCQLILGSLDIPQPFDLPAFVASVASLRGRHISLTPFRAGPDGLCGAWIRARSTDYIYYDDQTTPLHQAHIVLHEIAHMLLGHHSAGPTLLPGPRPLAGPGPGAADAEPESGGSYAAAQEREAETLASMILERAGRRPARLPADRKPAGEPPAALATDRPGQAAGSGQGTAR